MSSFESQTNPHDWIKLANFVYRLNKRQVDAICVHGWGDLRDETIAYVAELYRDLGAQHIILNGAENYETHAPGFSYWKDVFVRWHGISPEKIIATKPARHTYEEALGIMEVVKQKNIKSLAMVTVPLHVLRAFLTNLSVMKSEGMKLKLYPHTLPGINWHEEVSFKPLIGPGEDTMRIARFIAECVRIIDYRRRQEEGDANFKIASIREGLEYFEGNMI